MRWFKHGSNFRSSPAMFHIQRELGDSGFARAVKLIEIMTEKSGSGVNFNPRLELFAPTDEKWLAFELGCPLEELNETLEIFEQATFIELEMDEDRMGAIIMNDLASKKDSWSDRYKPESDSTTVAQQRGHGLQSPGLT
jgi:hypothetical protein